MWTPLWRSWATSRPRPSVSRQIITLGLALALVLAALPGPVYGQAPSDAPLAVQVSRQSAEASFSESLTFSLGFESDTPVAEVILFYGVEGARIVRRIYPDWPPGSTSLTHTVEIEPGQYTPGQVLVYWWRLIGDDGRSFDTPHRTVLHADERFDWDTLQDGQLTLHWYGDRGDAKQAQKILDAGTRVIGRLKDEMGVSGEEKIHIWVYNTQRDMKRALSSRSDAYDELILTLGVAIGHDTLLLLGSDSGVEGTVAHELSHIVTHMATDNPYTTIPRWLDEGLAMVAEDELPSDNVRALEEGIRNDELLTVRSMSSYSGRAELVDLYYGEVHSVVTFMIETWGRESISELLDTMAGGVPQEQALMDVYGFDLEELDGLWRESLGLERRTLPASEFSQPSRLVCIAG